MPGFSKVAILSGLVALAAAQQPEWGQCGGIGWTGATTCASPWVCTVINAYYYQCLPASSSATTATPTTTTGGQTTTTTVTRTTTTVTGTVSGGLKARFGSRYYGAALASSNFGDSSYTALAKANIDMATAENECKFDATEPSNGGYSYSSCDTVYNFVAGLGGRFRGHNLVWHQQVPSWVNSLSGSAVQSAMVAHIQNLLAHYKGKFYCWDVVNEAFADSGGYNSSPWYTAMGANFINIAFQTARSADPNVKLYYNDYNIEYSGGKSTNAYNLVKSLKSSNIIDGVGFEAHYIVGQTPNSASTAASFVALGVEFAYTELDIRMPTPASSANLAQQSVDYANVVSYCIGNSACVGVTTWGLTDKYSWIPGTFSGQGAALPWDSNYNPKPAYTGIYNAA